MKKRRLICAKCGACADHEEDRVDGKCHHCGDTRTIKQIRTRPGHWIDEEQDEATTIMENVT